PWAQTVADAVRIDIRRVVDFAPLRGIEEDSVAAAHHRLVGEPVGKAESWGERFFRTWVGHRAAKPEYGSAGRIPSRCHAVFRKLRVGEAQPASRVFHIEPEEVVLFLIGGSAIIP